jgi:uncharacterized protein YkwD
MTSMYTGQHGKLTLITLLIILSAADTLVGIRTAAPDPIKPSITNDGASQYLPLVSKSIPPTPTPTSTPPGCGLPFIPPDDLANEQAILDGLNTQRTINGLAELAVADELTQAARRHSRDMADQNFTGHTGSDGTNGGQRMKEACYNWSTWAEIIGWGFGGNTTAMIDWWMNSQVHHDIILSTKFDDFGTGYAYNTNSDYQDYWTVNFGKRAANASVVPQKMYDCVYISIGTLGGSMAMVHSSEPCQ